MLCCVPATYVHGEAPAGCGCRNPPYIHTGGDHSGQSARRLRFINLYTFISHSQAFTRFDDGHAALRQEYFRMLNLHAKLARPSLNYSRRIWFSRQLVAGRSSAAMAEVGTTEPLLADSHCHPQDDAANAAAVRDLRAGAIAVMGVGMHDWDAVARLYELAPNKVCAAAGAAADVCRQCFAPLSVSWIPS